MSARPKLYLHGLSLGALNSDLSFNIFDIVGDPFQGALWSGPPFPSVTWRAATAGRDPQSPAWLPRFLVYWTLKEAYLKARGLGIGVPLEDISFDLAVPDTPRITFRNTLAGEDDRWAFTLWQPSATHLVAVAASTADGLRPTVTMRTIVP